MIENRWQDAEARKFEDAAGDDPAARALALRVYSSRLIGAEPDLVMHGGGNTSLKLTATDLYGDPVEVIHIKGSGWDLAAMEAREVEKARAMCEMAAEALGIQASDVIVASTGVIGQTLNIEPIQSAMGKKGQAKRRARRSTFLSHFPFLNGLSKVVRLLATK